MAESWMDVLSKVGKKKGAINVVVLQPPSRQMQSMRMNMGYTGAGANGIVEPGKPAMYDKQTRSVYHEGEGVMPMPGGKQVVPASQMPGMMTPQTEQAQASLATLNAPGYFDGGFAHNVANMPNDLQKMVNNTYNGDQQHLYAPPKPPSYEQQINTLSPAGTAPVFTNQNSPAQTVPNDLARVMQGTPSGQQVLQGKTTALDTRMSQGEMAPPPAAPSMSLNLAPQTQVAQAPAPQALPAPMAPTTAASAPAPTVDTYKPLTPTLDITKANTTTGDAPTTTTTPPAPIVNTLAPTTAQTNTYRQGALEGFGQIRDVARGQSSVNADIRSATMNNMDANAAAGDAATIARLRSEGASPEEINAYMLNQNRSNQVQRAGAMKDIAISEGTRAEGASRDLATLGRDAYTSDRNFNQDVLESDRNYNRDVLTSDRNYNRDVLTGDRNYNRDVLTSDRNYGRDAYTSDRAYNDTVKTDAYNKAMDQVNTLIKAGGAENYASAAKLFQQQFPGVPIDFSNLIAADNGKALQAGLTSLNSFISAGIEWDQIPQQAQNQIISDLGGDANSAELMYSSLKGNGNVYQRKLDAIKQYIPGFDTLTPAQQQPILDAVQAAALGELNLIKDPKTGEFKYVTTDANETEMVPVDGHTPKQNELYVAQDGKAYRSIDGVSTLADVAAMSTREQNELLANTTSGPVFDEIASRRAQDFVNGTTTERLDTRTPIGKAVYQKIIESPNTLQGIGGITVNEIGKASTEDIRFESLEGTQKGDLVNIGGKIFVTTGRVVEGSETKNNSRTYYLTGLDDGSSYLVRADYKDRNPVYTPQKVNV